MGRFAAQQRTRFGRWILGYGVSRLTRDLGARGQPVTRRAAYWWAAGHKMPRPAIARVLVEVAGGSISLDDIYGKQLTR
jgi:hypothetical protein